MTNQFLINDHLGDANDSEQTLYNKIRVVKQYFRCWFILSDKRAYHRGYYSAQVIHKSRM